MTNQKKTTTVKARTLSWDAPNEKREIEISMAAHTLYEALVLDDGLHIRQKIKIALNFLGYPFDSDDTDKQSNNE
ncbi:hypothetical protein SAMN04487969_102516 [Paenibacillus algorifonticola]|uniref:Uncharacterized protein n=1 Tax=Paenibacillus algorifonticola TaxID=684063 RepID=A0A1I2ALI3_9BACL|nr:hypothetical protein [Paenibacillus algorifonticola]SFE43813.1 hypothetical protein SAMN04487969_102516 [Paenibacillus algorifonticola]